MTKILIDEAVVWQALEALENAWLDASMGKGDVARHTKAITALRQALEQPAPAHCEAGPEYCQQCCKESFEDRSLALAAAVRYVKNNTPNLVWTEIERALTTPPAPAQPLTDANKQFNAAINFAIDQGIEAAVFLAAWREGDTVEWPEFDSYIAAHGITKGN